MTKDLVPSQFPRKEKSNKGLTPAVDRIQSRVNFETS